MIRVEVMECMSGSVLTFTGADFNFFGLPGLEDFRGILDGSTLIGVGATWGGWSETGSRIWGA